MTSCSITKDSGAENIPVSGIINLKMVYDLDNLTTRDLLKKELLKLADKTKWDFIGDLLEEIEELI